MPLDPKAVPFDPFHNYPNRPVSELPLDLPREFREQLACLLPHPPTIASVSNLVYFHRDSTGNPDYAIPVVNRPWEWIENLGDPAAVEPRGDEGEGELKAKSLVKNSGSLPLDAFNARMTGDSILRNSEKEIDARTEGDLRTFQDGLTGESVFKRGWRETRIELETEVLTGHPTIRMKGEIDYEAGGITGNPGNSKEKRITPRGSPSSVVSRSSARGSTTSMRQSPLPGLTHKGSNSTTSDVIDLDNIPTATLPSTRESSNKRKAGTITVSDDEIEVIEGPLPAQGLKRTKAKAPTKTRGKKK